MKLPAPIERFLGDRRFWEGRYVDPWSAAHLISGALVAYGLILLAFGFWAGLAASIVLAILWELFEKAARLSDTEHFTNNLTDIIFAQVGFIPAYREFQTLPAATDLATVLLLAAVFALIVIVGWISYTYYRCNAAD